MQSDNFDKELKLILVGNSGVGKTSLITRYKDHDFSYSINSTIGAEFFSHIQKVDDHRVRVNIWDTSGNERFRAIAPNYYKDALIVVVVYDLQDPKSAEDVMVWLQQIVEKNDNEFVKVVAGNKTDLVNKQE